MRKGICRYTYSYTASFLRLWLARRKGEKRVLIVEIQAPLVLFLLERLNVRAARCSALLLRAPVRRAGKTLRATTLRFRNARKGLLAYARIDRRLDRYELDVTRSLSRIAHARVNFGLTEAPLAIHKSSHLLLRFSSLASFTAGPGYIHVCVCVWVAVQPL